MKIEHIELHHIEMDLVHPFRTSFGVENETAVYHRLRPQPRHNRLGRMRCWGWPLVFIGDGWHGLAYPQRLSDPKTAGAGNHAASRHSPAAKKRARASDGESRH